MTQPHGTKQRYKTCHCDVCKRGNTLRMRNYRGGPPRNQVTHPSHTTYMYGCHCDDCKAINTAYGRQYRATLKQRRARQLPGSGT